MKVSGTTIEFTAAEAEAIERLRASFTPAQLAEMKRRQQEGAKLIAKLAATETLEAQQQLADELCPKFDRWIHARNRIRSTPTRTVAIISPRTREHRPSATRRTSSSSRTSSADPGDPDPDPEPPPGIGHFCTRPCGHPSVDGAPPPACVCPPCDCKACRARRRRAEGRAA